MQSILIAEDDRELRQLLVRVLRKNGYGVETAADGKEGLSALEREFDLVIAEADLPKLSGFELAQKLREKNNPVPVLLLTAKETFDEMRHGFLGGSEAFLIKPISVSDLMRMVRTLLRRSKTLLEHRQVLGDTVLEEESMTVTADGRPMVLPPMEFRLLYKMAENPGHIFTRQQLTDELSGTGDAVEEQLRHLQERFHDSRDFRIVSMRGIGYKVVPSHALQ